MPISDTDHAYQLGYAKGLKESRHTLAQAIAAEMNKVREEDRKSFIGFVFSYTQPDKGHLFSVIDDLMREYIKSEENNSHRPR